MQYYLIGSHARGSLAMQAKRDLRKHWPPICKAKVPGDDVAIMYNMLTAALMHRLDVLITPSSLSCLI
jgi:hypothetical protein